MRTHRPILALMTVFLGMNLLGPSTMAAPQSASLSPVVTVLGATPDMHSRMDDALKLFRDRGLELPDMVINFAIDAPDACNGHLGLYQQTSGAPLLTICRNLRFVITHEIAHAWIETSFDDASRRIYTEFRGLDTWNGAEYEWSARAAEDAATVIQENLMLVGQGMIVDRTHDRINAYEAITGQRSPLQAAQ